MKKIFLLLSFLLIAATVVTAQTMTVSLSGAITADSTGAPVANHEVVITSDSSGGFVFYATRITGANGFYDCVIHNVPTATPVTFIVKTHDCNNNIVQHSFLSTSSPAVVNFVICVHPTNCEAAFIYYQDSTNFHSFHFNSTSYVPAGVTITSYNWNFGDGTTGHTYDPWHTYANAGNYHVCLTIVTSNGCTSTKCKVVEVGEPPVNCENWFSYAKNMLTVNFEGHTHSPYPTTWSWNFGDPLSGTNNTSNLRVPQHIFTAPGAYIVSLHTVDSSGCEHTSYQNIYVHNTVDIHGSVHAGEHFVDHGFIQLIRVDSNNMMTVVDSKEFGDSAGMYAFGGVPAGHYYLKAELLPVSAYYGQFVPTYYHEALNWTSAELIIIGEPQNPYNFGLRHVTGPLTGNGNISGTITQSTKVNAGGTPAANVEVLLLNEQSVALAYVKTDVNGHFEFPGIALGSYIIWPEVTGLATSPAHITLNSTTSSVILPFSMTNNQVAYGICETLPDYFSEVGDIFPNPAAGALASITVTVTRELMIDLTLFNVTGQAVYTHQTAVHKGFNLIRFDVANLAKGPYYLQLRSSEGGSVVKKLSVIK